MSFLSKIIKSVVDSLEIQNFRGIDKITIKFSPLTLVFGPNGSGKTSILESIRLISTGKSDRESSSSEMISWSSDITKIKLNASSMDFSEVLLTLTKGHLEFGGILKKTPKKRLLVDGIPKRPTDFVGGLPTVIFSPDDMDYFSKGPSVRRDAADSVLSQISSGYRANLSVYSKALTSRNSLLKRIREGKSKLMELDWWDDLIVKKAEVVERGRKKWVEHVNQSNTLGDSKYRLDYLESKLSMERLKECQSREIASGTTLIGPHRDDFCLHSELGGQMRMLEKFGSRGQQRMGVLWLKSREIDFLRSFNKQPILLLDDIMSELDDEHREVVLGFTQSLQTIVTTSETFVLGMFEGKSNIVNLS